MCLPSLYLLLLALLLAFKNIYIYIIHIKQLLTAFLFDLQPLIKCTYVICLKNHKGWEMNYANWADAR